MSGQKRGGRVSLWWHSVRANWRRLRGAWEIFAANRLAVAGLLIILLFGVLTLVYPLLRATVWQAQIYNPLVGFDVNSVPHPSPPSWIPPEFLAADNVHRFDRNRPSYDHLLGTDTVGRDVLSVLLASTGPSLLVGVTAALVTAVVGLVIGSVAAVYGGRVDGVLSHLSDAFLLLPPPIFMIAVGSFLRDDSLIERVYQAFTGNGLSDTVTTVLQPVEFGLIYGLVAGAGGAAIVIRSQGLKIMQLSFIEASRVAGAGGRQIIWHHLIPNLMPLAALYMMITVTGAVVADSFLAFLGFNATRLNWGTMIYNAFTYRLLNNAITWNVLIPAGAAISLFAASFYMVSRGLHEVAEPRLRQYHEIEFRGSRRQAPSGAGNKEQVPEGTCQF